MLFQPILWIAGFIKIGDVMSYIEDRETNLRSMQQRKDEFYLVVSRTGFVGFHLPGEDRIGAICYHCGAHVCVRRNAHKNICPVLNKNVDLVERHLRLEDLEDLSKQDKQMLHWPNFLQTINHGVVPVVTDHFDQG